MCKTEDQDIILLFEQRDEQALAETTSRFGTLARALAKNITGSTEESEECLNDALLTAWNAIPPTKPQNLRAYFVRLVHNAAVNLLEHNSARKRGSGQFTDALDELADCLPSRGGVEQTIEQRELTAAIMAYLGTLPKKQRDLFVRRYWYADSVSKLAALFGMTENSVKVTLSRIRTRMQEHLRKEGLL